MASFLLAVFYCRLGVRLTLAHFFTPVGEPYSGVGVTPHILESADLFKAAIDQARQLLAMR
jgi:C-terminal processing protease CtpA/Prc